MFKYYVLAAIGLIVGIYLVLRDDLPYDKMTKIRGKIIERELVEMMNTGRGRYEIFSLAFQTDGSPYKIGIRISDHEFNLLKFNETNNLFDAVSTYTFYLNPLSMNVSNKCNCTVVRVDKENKIIFQDKSKKHQTIGLIIILVTILFMIWKIRTYDPATDTNFFVSTKDHL